jgi:large subunit ribosomal protein L25
MKTFEISCRKRSLSGTTGANNVRKSGDVPCVMYGAGEPVHLVSTLLQLEKLLASPETHLVKITLEEDGSIHNSIVKEVQVHPVTDEVTHMDFFRVTDDKPIEVQLPIKFKGTSVGVIAGGTLLKKLRKLKVKGLLKDIPAYLDVDISTLDLGKTIKVMDVSFENLTVTTPGSATIASIEIPRSLRGQS